MRVTIGTIMNPIGTNKNMNTEKKFQIHLKNLRHRVESLYLQGYKHIRIPHIIPNCSYEEMVTMINRNIDVYKYYEGLLSSDLYSLSNHAMYQYFKFEPGKELKALLDYYRKIFYLVQFLGIKRYYHVTHLTEHSRLEIVEMIRDILDYETSGMFSKCVYIENCDKGKTTEQVLSMCKELKLNKVYDNLHNKINQSKGSFSYNELCNNGRKAILHYSNSYNYQCKHNDILDLEEFIQLILSYEDVCDDLLIMVELVGQSTLIPKLKINTRNLFNWDRNFYEFETYNL